MRRIIQKIKNWIVRIKYRFRVLVWAMKHSQEVKNYQFLVELRNHAYEKMLKTERNNPSENLDILKIQIKLLDKIINYTNG